MSASTAIGLVGESLKSLLEGEMQLTPATDVTLLGPDESHGNRRLNLFLYKVQESPFQRNMEWQVAPGAPGRLDPPPLTLNLFYLMTPYASNDPDTGHTNAHAILGEAMRVFHQFPVIPDAHLNAGLRDAREQVKITPSVLDLDELSKVWSTFGQPFRVSVAYEVSVVSIDQSAEQQRPLPERVRSIGVPEVVAPFAPPVLERMAPTSGPAGTTVTFTGRYLEGWQAHVALGRRRLVDGEAIEGRHFDATLPADLMPGYHQLQVDVAHLTRTTFFFEVTP
ncbi:DUF4255 domain-containing protein [Halomonas ramblicola]|uniref:DUF4255 domain-containing protein n=1 Tax=Halomonas ramblicola TaxID=747349 RepID=UPI0025B53A29|nr:DUF4255 domain-containing protein [Halomonas ramblicola]MDN3522562.1 DUF4255 domain-containing protein [Halomonas ramblicola]